MDTDAVRGNEGKKLLVINYNLGFACVLVWVNSLGCFFLN